MLFSSATTRSAFSLLELLVVILLVSIIYFLGFSGIEKSEKKAQTLTPLTLKSTILHSGILEGEGALLCINQCKNCYLRSGIHSDFKPYRNKIDLTESTVYSIDEHDTLVKMEPGRYHDRKICLFMQFYTNGSSTQMIIKNKKGIFFLPSFFGKPQKVGSLEEAKAVWLQNSYLLSDSGDFY